MASPLDEASEDMLGIVLEGGGGLLKKVPNLCYSHSLSSTQNWIIDFMASFFISLANSFELSLYSAISHPLFPLVRRGSLSSVNKSKINRDGISSGCGMGGITGDDRIVALS